MLMPEGGHEPCSIKFQNPIFCFFLSASGFCFGSRSRRPPLNEVNSLLSFGYTVLYSTIATLTLHGSRLSYQEILMRDVQSLTRYFRNGEAYVPFKQVK